MRRIMPCLLIIFITVSAHAVSVLDELQARQKDIKTVKAHFVQEKFTKVLKSPIKSKGVFYFGIPDSVRWQYEKGLTVLYDGRSLYIYYPELKEAEKISSPKVFAGLMSFNLNELKKQYDIAASEAQSEAIIKMSPKTQSAFSSLEMIFKKDEIFPSEVRMEEKTGDITIIRFTDISLNTELPKDIFVFSPPADVKIKTR